MNQFGFTLIELLVVIAIIAILATHPTIVDSSSLRPTYNKCPVQLAPEDPLEIPVNIFNR
jgi:prepilin-type N-terminal cleavage/methylation domain-containing protein